MWMGVVMSANRGWPGAAAPRSCACSAVLLDCGSMHHRLSRHAERDERVADGLGFAAAVHLGVREPAGGNHQRRVQQAIEPRALDGVVGRRRVRLSIAEPRVLVADDAVPEHDDRRGCGASAAVAMGA